MHFGYHLIPQWQQLYLSPVFLLGRQGATELSLIMEKFLLLLPPPSPPAALPSSPGWPALLWGPMGASLGATLQRMQRCLAAAPTWVEKEKMALCMWSQLHFPVDLLCPQVQPAPLARKQAFLISLGELGPCARRGQGQQPQAPPALSARTSSLLASWCCTASHHQAGQTPVRLKPPPCSQALHLRIPSTSQLIRESRHQLGFCSSAAARTRHSNQRTDSGDYLLLKIYIYYSFQNMFSYMWNVLAQL